MLPDKSITLLSDTVGFIRKLPPSVISAFRATLEELTEATLLLHVVDFSSDYAAEQCQVVEDILKNMDIGDKPVITALNKIDLLLDLGRRWTESEAMNFLCAKNLRNADPNTVIISAARGWGIKELLEKINQAVDDMRVPIG
jgi:GTP-binding protein HflX